MGFILFYVNLGICENKLIAMNMREQFQLELFQAMQIIGSGYPPYNHLIKKLNICNITLAESGEYDVR